MTFRYTLRLILSSCLLLFSLYSVSQAQTLTVVDRPAVTLSESPHYLQNAKPLLPNHLLRLPVCSVEPRGWLRTMLELQRDGLCGHLGEISRWLDKRNNAWLGTGNDYGWEEVPYWLKGYAEMAYILGDETMIEETRGWIEAVFRSQRDDGYFGPYIERNGRPDLWGNMIMLRVMQSYYEYSRDQRVLDLMKGYFRWELALPEEKFLKDYWENSRGGDNLRSVYWLYNLTQDPKLLELAHKIHRNTANWRMRSALPNWHNVNVAQCFREPATYYQLSGDSADLLASYNVHYLIRNIFGQVPGGMFGADENARQGYVDPRQGTETCGFVEQMASDEIMLGITGDPRWAEHCEDVCFNSFPAAMMPDLRALRYITSPNQAISDARNHHPGIDNKGPFLAMNPFSSRCCQHNHGLGWPYFISNLVYATPDRGIALAMYGPCKASVRVGKRGEVSLSEETEYPFGERIRLRLSMDGEDTFPIYLRVPSWSVNPSVTIRGKRYDLSGAVGRYARLEHTWRVGDVLEIEYPMHLSDRYWETQQGSRSIDFGPLTFSLMIDEQYREVNSVETAIGDSRWQEGADPTKWKSYEILPGSPWNYALVMPDRRGIPVSWKVERKSLKPGVNPFTLGNVPLRLQVKGRRLLGWKIDEYGLTGEIPIRESRTFVPTTDTITLVPMGAARLRISSFPTINH